MATRSGSLGVLLPRNPRNEALALGDGEEEGCLKGKELLEFNRRSTGGITEGKGKETGESSES